MVHDPPSMIPAEARIDHRRPSLSDAVILVLGLAVLLNYVDRANLATAAPLLQDELSLSSAQIGVLLSSFFWVYAPAQLLSGWLVHRFDIRLVLAAGLTVWALATAMTGAAVGFASILVLRLILGLGESVMFPGYQLILARETAEHERGRANGLIGAGQGFGPMLGTLFGGLAMARFGWRVMFVGLGVITLAWLWPWFIVTRHRRFDNHSEEAAASVSYTAILRRREFWGAALGHFAINYAFYFVITWLPTFLVKAGGFTVSQMAGIGAAIYGVYAVATALAGAVSDRWIRHGGSATLVRKTFAVTSAIGAAVTIAGSALVEPRAAVWLLGAAGVFFGLSTPTMFAMTGTLAGPRAAGRWAGAQNVAGQLAGIIAPIVTGLIVDRTGAFSWAFVVSAASAILALVAWGVVIRRVETVRWSEEDDAHVEV
jgi:MFS family permease